MTIRLRLFALTLAASALSAQTTDATVSGTVTDSSGAHVAGVQVAAVHTETGVATNTATNATGVYVFAALQPGTYNFTAEHPGFRKTLLTAVTLEIGAKLTANMTLELGATTETVEVQSSAAIIGYATSSVGNVVSGRQVLELPLAGRSTYDLISTQAGVVGANVSGNRTGSLNVTTDGINAQDNLLNGLFYIGVANQIRVDRVEEFRIVTSPTDVEMGRGAGQIQVITRSGTNNFHGSVWEEHRNTALNANNWFNNSRGNDPVTGQMVSPRDVLIRNQYGARMGGPLKKNRTFFNGYYEGERQRQRNSTTATVFTDAARRGIYRFFPGVQNANANALAPTVDLSGNPVKPAGATGDLQSLDVFSRDPNRKLPDPSGTIAKQLSYVPLPNNYRAGDGLNTAGFTWQRPVRIDFATYEFKVDHMFSTKHRASVSFSHQAYDSLNVAGPQPLPASPGGRGPTETTQYFASLTSVLRPNLLNEFRAGVFRPRTEVVAPYDPKAGGPDIAPRAAGDLPYIIDFTSITEPLAPTNFGSDNSNRLSPVYQYGDSISWLKGRHSFKGGVEFRFVSSAGYDAYAATPRATIGAVFVPVQGITTVAGIGQNSGGAQNLLLDLSGSIGSGYQVYNSPGGSNPVYLSGLTRYRNWIQHEFSGYFKDDFKVNSNLTLNLGVRYEWYAVPYERQGKGLAPVGGGAGLFGISGSGFADLFQPGHLAGQLTTIQLIGPNTAHPDTKLYNNDNNNFAPGVGLAWTLPWLDKWFGKNKTTFRAGYGIGYERNPIYLAHNASGLEPGLSETTAYIPLSLITPGTLKLPYTPSAPPLTTIPLASARTQSFTGFDQNLRNPYVQNWNVSITRVLPGNAWFDIRYVGTKGTKLVRAQNANEVNIVENGILDAFRTTQRGGNAPLLDKIFLGLSGVNGTTVTGSDFVRSNSSTQGFLVSNDPAGFANYLNTTTQLTGVAGGLGRRVGLPENFIVANPQVATSYLTGNFSNSTYNSMQVEVIKRLTSGWTFQGNYTWSKTLGDYDGEDTTLTQSFRTLRNLRLDKKLLGYDRLHVFRSNGIWELPFGPGKWLGRNTNKVTGKIIGGWQTGVIFNKFSGAPVNFSAVNAFNTVGGATPVAVGTIPSGAVQKVGNGVVYFNGYQQVIDPSVAQITTLQNLQSRSPLRAIADSSGKLLLVNAQPGQIGMQPNLLRGPGTFRLDVNLIKNVSVTERVKMQIRADAINFTNTPQFGNPDAGINSTNFGRITSAGDGRIVVLQARVSF